GATTPFPFFCDFPEPLASAVRKGRREEFKAAYAAFADAIPDPLEDATFRSAVLDWDQRGSPVGRRRLDLVRELLAVRRREVTPHLATARFDVAQIHDRALHARWHLRGGRALLVSANLSDAAATRPPQSRTGRPIWGEDPGRTFPPWAVFWSIGGD